MDHYVPTKPTIYEQYYKWKTEKELAPILSARLLVIEEMNLQFLSDEQQKACNEPKACIVKHLPSLSIQVNAAYHAMAAHASGCGVWDPVFHQVPTGKISSSSGQPDLSSAHPTAFSSIAATDDSVPGEDCPPPSRKRKKQSYICHLCDQEFSRKPSLTGHLWKKTKLENQFCVMFARSLSPRSQL